MALQGDYAGNAAVRSQADLLEIWLRAQMAFQQQPGIAVAIVHDQELVYAGGFGEGISAESIYRIASHSKLFTAISLLQLRDAGKLRLDEPITTYLPWFNIQNKFGNAPVVTIRHLLTHTSGSPREAGSGYWIDFNFPTAAQVRERLGGQTAALPTENRFKYSNLAYGLAGYIVEAVSGQSFEAYVGEHILQPLGMSSTSVVFPEEHADRLVTGYGRRMPDGTREVMPFIDARGLAAATGVSSSVGDMALFMQWQLRCIADEDDSILKGSTLREMQRVHWLEPNWNEARGLGFGIARVGKRSLIGHGGGYPGYLTYTAINPDTKIGISVFTSSLDGQPNLIAGRILNWFAPALAKAKTDNLSEATPAAWANYVGTYRSHWTDSHVMIYNGKLTVITPTLTNPKVLMYTLEPNEDGSFTLQGTNGGRAVGERVDFEGGDQGPAGRVCMGFNWMTRVEYDVALSG